jgi:hypothetical protein
VPEYCTCGAELPPDARFCHKCGKPQRDEPLISAEPEAVPVAPLPPIPSAPPAPAAIDFRNPRAVRAGLYTALVATLLSLVAPYACPLWLVAAGFLCVFLYQRRTGEVLFVKGGAQIGWITGLFSSTIFAVVSTTAFISQVRSGELFETMKKEAPAFAANAEQLRQSFSNPGFLICTMLFYVIMLFVVFTVLSIAGGALGAKILGKE